MPQLYSIVFDSTIYNNARDVHSIAMQEQPVTMHSSFNVCITGITCMKCYYKTQLYSIYLETAAKFSKWFLALLLLNYTCCCELVAIATIPTASVMCQEMSTSPANVVELHV